MSTHERNDASDRMQQQQRRNPLREGNVARMVGVVLQSGSLSGSDVVLTTSLTTPEVWVHQIIGGRPRTLVAYSSTSSDRLSSIEEFVDDFFA